MILYILCEAIFEMVILSFCRFSAGMQNGGYKYFVVLNDEENNIWEFSHMVSPELFSAKPV